MQIRQMLQCHVDKDNIKDKNQEKKYQKNNYNIKMRTRTTTWFECKIRYEKMMEDGMQKKVTELYVVDALTFTEAESAIIEEMSSYISGEFEVRDIKKAPMVKSSSVMNRLQTVGIKRNCSLSPSTRKRRKRSVAI